MEVKPNTVIISHETLNRKYCPHCKTGKLFINIAVNYVELNCVCCGFSQELFETLKLKGK